MLVLAISSAKPKSLNTTRVSTAGASFLRHATIPALSGSITSFVRLVEQGRQSARRHQWNERLCRRSSSFDRHAEIEAQA